MKEAIKQYKKLINECLDRDKCNNCKYESWCERNMVVIYSKPSDVILAFKTNKIGGLEEDENKD